MTWLAIASCLFAAWELYKLQERVIRVVKAIINWWDAFKLRPRGTLFWCWILGHDLIVINRNSCLLRRCRRCYEEEVYINSGEIPRPCNWTHNGEYWRTGCDWETYADPPRRCPNCRRKIASSTWIVAWGPSDPGPLERKYRGCAQ